MGLQDKATNLAKKLTQTDKDEKGFFISKTWICDWDIWIAKKFKQLFGKKERKEDE